ncbi:MAG: LptF/LptG family permease, partial [Thermoleophilia bacterium]|nr:LptF/LptG family permease [Thermoleophilia bacterium]
PRNKRSQWSAFTTFRKTLVLPRDDLEKVKMKHLTTAQLTDRLRRGKESEGWVRSARIAIQSRRSLALSCLAFALLGVPLGLIARKGNKLVGFGLAVVVMFVLYYPLLVAGKNLSEEAIVQPWVGLWIPNVVVGVIGLALLIPLLRK